MTARVQPARVVTIPNSDAAFGRHVERLRSDGQFGTARQLEARLRGLFPRVVVRERELSGEPPVWYVYRDGRWQPPDEGPWFASSGLPRLELTLDGWLAGANPTARSLMGLGPHGDGARHITDFVVPGTLADVESLFQLVVAGHVLDATVLLRPTSGDVLAVDFHARRDGNGIVVVMRLADVEPVGGPAAASTPLLRCEPESDAAFRDYAALALSRMPEPTPDGLALRLRRLYPHAQVESSDHCWTVRRDRAEREDLEPQWWLDERLPRVTYDGQALILDANEAARQLLGSELVGHFWQEFVTAGSARQVSAMLAILARLGAAESRFQLPSADGSLVEFDSYTSVSSDTFVTVMRPRSQQTP